MGRVGKFFVRGMEGGGRVVNLGHFKRVKNRGQYKMINT